MNPVEEVLAMPEAGSNTTPLTLPFEAGEGTPVPMLEVDERAALITLTVRHLLQVVPDPIAAEKPDRIAEDARLRAYGQLRAEVQRLVEGAKKKNAFKYGDYLVGGHRGLHPSVTPPITLFHREPLKTVDLGGGAKVLLLPHGEFFPAIDGETQRLAWGFAAQEEESLLDRRIAAIIHHGRPVEDARQFFHDLNTLEVKPNAAVAISMDARDPATQIARAVMDQVPQLQGRVNVRRRQLRRHDPEVLTISGLRTGIVTTILGEAGLQVGSRPVTLPDGVEIEDIEAPIVRLWSAILGEIEDELEPDRRPEVVVSAPSILAGLGVLAHQAMPAPPRETMRQWTVEEVVDCLADVGWEREYSDPQGNIRSAWEGIAGKFTPKGRFSIGGPKEVGHMVASALKEPRSDSGQSIRS